jgi:hypothetical protein
MIDIINLEIVNSGLYYHDKILSDPQLCQVVYSPDLAASLRNFVKFSRHESFRSYFILSHGSIILVTITGVKYHHASKSHLLTMMTDDSYDS